jgi:hypothetical protein
MDKTMPTSSTSTPNALPDAWIERLFNRMEDRYGSLWAERYGAFPRARVMRTWAEDLADMSRDELARGVAACRDRKYPPTLPEFRELCRPSIDYEQAFLEAVEQMRKRATGEDVWSTPAVYWAATKLAGDLQAHPYASLKGRWQAALDEAVQSVRTGKLPAEVPKRRDALPAPGRSIVPPEVARQRLAEIMQQLTAKMAM